MKRLVYLFFSVLCISGYAQGNADKFVMNAVRIDQKITIDGNLDEIVWQEINFQSDFELTSPVDSVPATKQTEIAIVFDQDNIYVAGKAYLGDDDPVVQSLRRDFDFGSNDNICIYFEPFNDYTNGFMFGLTPYGVQRDGLLTNGQEVSTDWDNKWYSEVQRYEDHWTFEMKIPFKSIRYNSSLDKWNMIILRNDLPSNERSTWATVPLGFRSSSMAFAGSLRFEDDLPPQKSNVAIIPFITGSTINDGDEVTNTADAGFDAKVGIGPSMNLDLTYNPDFSQVEVDRQVTNLDRFEIFFPERRQFFLENQDLFAEPGFGSIRPFFSRRIGISQDTLGRSRQIPIQYGARLSGKIGTDWRLGILNMQTNAEDNAMLTGTSREPGSYQLPGQNYSVAVLQKKVFSRSNIGAIVVNRQSTGFDAEDNTLTTSKYNRVVGLDYNLQSRDGKWEGDFFYHRSFDPDKNNEGAYAGGSFLRFSNTNVRLTFLTEAVGENYNAEVGFVRRKDILRQGLFTNYDFYTKPNSVILRHGPGLDFSQVLDTDLDRTDYSIASEYRVDFLNTSSVRVFVERSYEQLRRPFDPSGRGDQFLESGAGFTWTRYGVNFNTDRRKLFNADVNFSKGGFYNGERTALAAAVNYRYQPYGSVSVRVNYNDLQFPEPFRDTDFWLIGPEFDITFSRNIFLTTFVQYNEQIENINLNARLQWRYKPVSDVFIVYTENYLPAGFLPDRSLNRALVLKITYWLNV